MNLANIRRMIREIDMSKDALAYLLRCGGECEYLDYKENLHLDNDYGCATFARDVVAMKNTGGGYIVLGVQDKTWKPVGIPHRLDLDTKALRDAIRKSTGLDLDIDIVQPELSIDEKRFRFGLILVRTSPKVSKRRKPSLCKTDFHPRERWGIRTGDIYIRRGDSTIRVTSWEEIEEILDALDTKHDEQELVASQSQVSPFAIERGLYRLLPRDYDAFIGRESLKQEILQAIERDPRIWVINLHGPGGVGKTALATWAAYEYYTNQRDVFEAILFLSAKERELAPSGIKRLSPTLYSLENLLQYILTLFEHGEYVDKPLNRQIDLAIDLLKVFKTLLILDNMESVSDGRIINFIRDLPPGVLVKVLLTSRMRTSSWEYPIQVKELSLDEVAEFIRIRSEEMNLDDEIKRPESTSIVQEITGGLPLAIQWTLGRYAQTRDLKSILETASSPSSPLLEFSFRNSWNAMGEAARQAMAVLSIFDEPPTKQMWRTILDWPVDKLDKAIEDLQSMTFVYSMTDTNTGDVTYRALPITLTFSRNMLAEMGDLERECRARYKQHIESMSLVAAEVDRYQYLFETFIARSENEKKAIILCRIAEGQQDLGADASEQYYQQALELEPRSVYVLAKYGRFQVSLGRITEGLRLLHEATRRCTRQTGFFAYFNLAQAYDSLHQRLESAKALRKALEYDPNHVIARHMLGVALSRLGEYPEALSIFDGLIRDELAKPDGPTTTLAYAMKTKVITLRKARRVPEAKAFLEEAIKEICDYPHISHLVWELESLWSEFG